MSIIGYNSFCLTEEKRNYTRECLSVFSVHLGISGYAQVCGRDSIYYKIKETLDDILDKTCIDITKARLN